MSRQELKGKMLRATRGTLRYGRGKDVEQMNVAPEVLELRLTARPGEGGQTHLIRLYFSEPDQLPDALLALCLKWKLPGPLMTAEQNNQARIAARRLDDHSRRPG